MRIIDGDLTKLKEKLTLMGTFTEAAIDLTIKALLESNSEISKQVIVDDDKIDKLENEIVKLAIDVMVLRQPAAGDLRFTVTCLQSAAIIERVADHAVNIAKHVQTLNLEPPLKPYIDLPRMAKVTNEMFHDSLQALIIGEAELARQTIRKDDQVDELFHLIYDELISIMKSSPDTITRGAELLFVIKHLERMADYATNICEMVIYMIEGRMIKHTEEAF